MRSSRPLQFLFTAMMLCCLIVSALPTRLQAQEAPPVPTQETPPPEPDTNQLPDGYTPPPALSGLSNADLADLQFPNQTSGSVQLDVFASPARFTAPQDLTYTFVYTNTQAGSASGIQIHATFTKWTKAAPSRIDPNRLWQYCVEVNCPPTTLAGPNVTWSGDLLEGSTITGQIYQIGDLAAGQSGRFSVTMRVPNIVYPVDGVEPRRPSGSGRLFLNNNTGVVISENSTSTLSTAPVFVLTKTRLSASKAIYPLDFADFIIRVENVQREDALPASNVTVTDYIPIGSEFVGMIEGPSPTQVTINNRAALQWTLPGTLNPGQFREFSLRFRKLDGIQCKNIVNRRSELLVSSSEMPLLPGSSDTRYSTTAKGDASYGVQVPVVIQSIAGAPNKIPFGDETTITIKVRNYWPQPVVNGQLTYSIQPNASYLPGTASDNPLSAPSSGAGGEVVWRLDMPAGSMTTPSEKSFTLGIRGLFTTEGNGNGLGSLLLPGDIPSGCTATKKGGVNLTPRLVVVKGTDVEPIDKRYYSQIGDVFPYFITLTNVGPDPIEDAAVVDLLPNEADANFKYAGDATLDDVAYPPDNFLDGFNGRIEWRGISLQPGETRTLRFGLIVDGTEFLDYCNELSRAEIELIMGETVTTGGKVCTRINPNFRLSKTLVDPADANLTQDDIPLGGREVKFRLQITNNDSNTFKLALYDFLPAIFTFSRVESSNAAGAPILNDRGHLEWEVQDVAVGGTLEAVIVTNFNPPCEKRSYTNELGFVFRNNQGVDAVYRSSPVTNVKINYLCGTNRITYSQKVDRSPASLGDRVMYTLSVSNKNIVDPVQNVTVVNILPLGFSFVGMANTAGLPTQSVRSDGRIQLTWTIPQIEANKGSNIQFVARTGSVVSSDERNRFYATAPNLLEATCGGKCEPGTNDGSDVVFSYSSLEVRPLHTYTPQLLADGQSEECGVAGSLRTYRLTMINTNTIAYTSTGVTTTLPLGLHFVRALGDTPHPRLVPQSDGTTQLIWSGLTIPKKPADAVASEYVLEVELELGQVWSDQATAVQVGSPDGIIPLTDGEIDPQVKICPPDGPAIAKDSSMRSVRAAGSAANQEFLYQIEVANPSDTALTLSIEDVLPPNVTFQQMVAGPNPSRNGATLRWDNLTVAAMNDQGEQGLIRLLFRVRVVAGEPGGRFTNQAIVVDSSAPVDVSLASIDVEIIQQEFIYLPMIQR